MDKKIISDTQYHELAMSNSEMVRLYKVKTAKKSMSSCVPLHTFANTSQIMEGAYRSVPDILDYQFTIHDFLAPWKDIEHPTLRLRFAGDGARTSRGKNTIVMCFNIIDEGTQWQ